MNTDQLSRLTPLERISVREMARLSSYSESTVRRRFRKYIERGMIDLQAYRLDNLLGSPIVSLYSLLDYPITLFGFPIYPPPPPPTTRREAILEIAPGFNLRVLLSSPYPARPGVFYVVEDNVAYLRPDFIPYSALKGHEDED